MGDRGNICIKQEDGSNIIFYSHWSGDELFDNLRDALIRGKSRWEDGLYLSRIIFCEMIKQDGLDGLTGFGISTHVEDNEHPIFVVDITNSAISLADDNLVSLRGGKQWTFQEFIELEKDPR